MKRVLFGVAAWLLAGSGAAALQTPAGQDPAKIREALRDAVAQQRIAEARSQRLQAQAARAVQAADKTSSEAAAVAASIQQAEAGIAAAEARIALVDRERATLRAQLGVEQEPLVRLTAALQQFSLRPVALSLLRPGSVKETVYTRALLANAVPIVRQRTAHLRTQLARSRVLRQQAEQLAGTLRDETTHLTERQQSLAKLESRQRLASRNVTGDAAREAEHALALGEQARDLDSLVGELDRAGELRRRLAALPGPVLRPPQPAEARLAAAPALAANQTSTTGPPPEPYLLPVAGRTVAGFGAAQDGGASSGITLAPRPGAQVVSPAAGRVVFAGPYRGYGRIAIIDHDGGWTSLVTGLSRLDVRVGDRLVGGSPLGVAGPGQPAISLELRRDGKPVNPLQFIR
jgi:septal ring factor EnvC (AmiA/AmiB activator)